MMLEIVSPPMVLNAKNVKLLNTYFDGVRTLCGTKKKKKVSELIKTDDLARAEFKKLKKVSVIKEKDLENTVYRFTLADGSVVEARGNQEVEYDGETHTAANLYDALKEGYYGKF